MPILKEWTCKACGHEFERIRAECPACESEDVARAFRTPPGINGGRNKAHSAKRTDEILEHQFNKLGVTNFSNAPGFGAPNKVNWSPKTFGPRATPAGGMAQEEIVAGFGMNTLIQSGFNPAGLMRDAQPFAIPTDAHGALIPAGVPLGGPPTELLRNTNVIGGIDVRGNQVVRVK